MRDRKVRVEVNISDLVPVTENHGGYRGRRCALCGVTGWEGESDYGYRHGTPDQVDGKYLNGMRHEKSCALNKYIDKNTGKLK